MVLTARIVDRVKLVGELHIATATGWEMVLVSE